MQIRLSKHFVDQWKIRVGSEPSVGSVQGIISDSIVIQKGKRFREVKTKSLYWHPRLNLILVIDHYSNTAITVLSEDIKVQKSKKKAAIKAKKPVRQYGYVKMTLHGRGVQHVLRKV